jgi:hypothetical protein
MELSWDFGSVDNSDLLRIVFENFNLTKIELLWRNLYRWPNRGSTDIKYIRLTVICSDDIYVQR